jgi:hypothetical protein
VSAGVDHVSAGVERISQTANGPQLWTALALAVGLSLLGARRQMARLPIWRRRRPAVPPASQPVGDGHLVAEPIAA